MLFRNVSKEDIDLVGGKGANLGELVQADFPVPDGFCISVEAYKKIVYGLEKDIDKILQMINWDKPQDIEEKSWKIRELIMMRSFPDDIKEGIVDAYRELSGGRTQDGFAVAVRSSATSEDLPDASFAGQQETYLNIRGEQEVLHYVKCCWASLWTARAMAYRCKQKYDHRKVFISVVIQLMVNAEVAGVAFSVNPLNSEEDEILINSSYGLGEVVVAGSVTPDSFTINKNNLQIINKQVGTKEKQLIQDAGGKTTLIEVLREMREEYSLTDNQLKELGKMVCLVEEHYQCPQDIEWAFYEGKIFLLQARPITTLNRSSQEDILFSGKLTKMQKFMLDDFIEHYPEAPTPLDYSVVMMSYQALLDRGIDLGLKGSKAEEILSMDKEGKFTLKPPLVRTGFKMLFLPLKLIKYNKCAPNLWNSEYQKHIDSILTYAEEKDLTYESEDVLIKQFEKIFHWAEEVCKIRFFFVIVASPVPLVILSMILKLFCPKNKRPEITDLVAGLEYKTAVIDRELNRLISTVFREPDIKSVIMDDSIDNYDDLKNKLLDISKGEEFLNQVYTFLKDYGYRTEKMYQPFSSKSWGEDFHRFMLILRAALQDSSVLERESKEIKRKNEHNRWVKYFSHKLKWPLRGMFKGNYEKIRENHVIREDTLFALEQLFTAGRQIANELGKRLVKKKYLEFAQDIVYLTRTEISLVFHGQIERAECRRMISARKNNHTANQVLWKNAMIKLSEDISVGEEIKGLAGSPGMIEGQVRVIMNINDFGKLRKGEILVCPYTDPTWTPLFGIAAAVVADTGGPLSHAAIVAREYGIPAVLGTKIATSSLKDGEIIVVNGLKGVVYKRE